MSINKKTFCVAPWFGLYLDSDKTISPCCEYKESHHHYNQIEEYFHSDSLNRLREDLLNGVKNTNCDSCWRAEEQGVDSLRMISNRTIGMNNDTRLMDQIEDPKLSNVKSFELTLGNLCNLKCVMCHPGLSSQLLAEVELNPSLKPRYASRYNPTHAQKDFDWPKTQDFVDWCDRYLPQAIHIKFTGGEPFIIPWLHDAIKKIPAQQKKKCILHFTTNLTLMNQNILDYFKEFKEVWLSVSVEGHGQTHEYLRFGHSWETLEKNIEHIIGSESGNLRLSINHVIQAPSYHSIMDMVAFFDKLQIQIHPIILTRPEWYSLSALTTKSKTQFIEATKNYNGHNREFVEVVKNASKSQMKQDIGLTKKLLSDLSALDTVRKNSYKKIIPDHHISIE